MLAQTQSNHPPKELTQPRFKENTTHIISKMVQYSTHTLEEIFKVSSPIAKELKIRFINHLDNKNTSLAAVESYNGVVYKHFKGSINSPQSQEYLQNHLRISSLLYGLLRPYDAIQPYRMEGFVRLEGSDQRVDTYWRDNQTQTLIDDVNHQGGTLLYLASKEEQNALHWKRVKESVRVIDFKFLSYKGDKLHQIVVYTKMARGEMISYMIQNAITDLEELKQFEWSGYKYSDNLSSKDVWVWLCGL